MLREKIQVDLNKAIRDKNKETVADNMDNRLIASMYRLGMAINSAATNNGSAISIAKAYLSSINLS